MYNHNLRRRRVTKWTLPSVVGKARYTISLGKMGFNQQQQQHSVVVGKEIRVVLTSDAEYTGLVFAYERALGLVVLQSPRSTFHFLKIGAIKSVSLVVPLTPPVEHPVDLSSKGDASIGVISNGTTTIKPKAMGVWATKPGAPTAAQVIAGKSGSQSGSFRSDSTIVHKVKPKPSSVQLLQVPPSKTVNVSKVLARENEAILAERALLAQFGPKGVSKLAQDIFLALAKTLPTAWKGDAIIVLDEVMIMAPYGIDDVRGTTPTSTEAVDRVQKMEVSNDADLQNEPLEVKVLDYDQLTYSDPIGSVFIDLNPLLAWDASDPTATTARDSNSLSGWFPIFDSLRGICGDIFITIKLNFFGDSNQFSQGSTGVQFFTSPSVASISSSHIAVNILGYVNSLEREDDPEFHWADNFRTPRTSNEARVRLLYKVSGQLRRQLGKKVLELGGNAVLGYRLNFDFETDQRCLTARASGTAVLLVTPERIALESAKSDSVLSMHRLEETEAHSGPNIANSRISGILQPQQQQQQLSQTPLVQSRALQSSLQESPQSSPVESNMLPLPAIPTNLVIKQADQFPVTLTAFPRGAVQALAGLVCATSVKILDSLSDSKEARDVWWAELRDEIKSHARTLKCVHVIGYSEHMAVCDELAVLYCYGTAAIIDVSCAEMAIEGFSAARKASLPESANADTDAPLADEHGVFESGIGGFGSRSLGIVNASFRDNNLLAHRNKFKKNRVGESHAVVVSESMPFAQYDIHRQLLFKLRIHGLNAIFGLKIQYSFGESLMTAVATGTAMFLKALPPPAPLKLLRTLDVVDGEDRQLVEEQRRIMEESEYNRKQIEASLAMEYQDQQKTTNASDSVSRRKYRNEVDLMEGKDVNTEYASDSGSEVTGSEDSDPEYDGNNRQRNVVVQIDDEHDEDLVLLVGTKFRDGFNLKNIEVVSKGDELANSNNAYTVQSITMIRQGFISLSSHHPNRQLARLFSDLYQEMQFQFSYVPQCTILGIDYNVQVVKVNEIQIRLTGVAVALDNQNSDEESQDDLDDGSFFNSLGRESPTRVSFSKPPIPTVQPVEASLEQETESKHYTQDDDSATSSEEDDDLVYSDDDDDGQPVDMLEVPNTPKENVASKLAPEQNGDVPNSALNTNATTKLFEATLPPISGGLVSSAVRQNQMTDLVQTPRAVEITPLTFIPQGRIERFLGRVSLHFVKEASILYESSGGGGGGPSSNLGGGLGGFTHALLAELYAVARSYTVALGGNAMVSFSVDTCMISENMKNQGYSLISISGDVVSVVHSQKREKIYQHCKTLHSVLLREF
ncbi:hypothetical protein HDU82_001069 [Entophlyctis luteolus]|nr:hypothetical protein HDU82_001069 [Entophlyctis luteolus]